MSWCQFAIWALLWLCNYSPTIRIFFWIRSHLRDGVGMGAAQSLLWCPLRFFGVSALFHVHWYSNHIFLFWLLLLAGPHLFFFSFNIKSVWFHSWKIHAIIWKCKLHNLNCPWHPLLKYRDSQPLPMVTVLHGDSFQKPESKKNLLPYRGSIVLFCFELSLKLVDFVYQMYIKIPVLCLGIVLPLSASWVSHLREIFSVSFHS